MEILFFYLQNFLETGNEKNLDTAATQVEQFASIVKAAVYGDKKLLGFNKFLSYSTEDREYFRIKDIAQNLEEHPDITKVYYWEKDSGQNIIEYIETNLERSRVFILFCTKNSSNSKSVKLERSAAIQLSQEERMRILPVFNNPSDIPLLIKPFLGLEYKPENFEEFIQNLYTEIFRN